MTPQIPDLEPGDELLDTREAAALLGVPSTNFQYFVMVQEKLGFAWVPTVPRDRPSAQRYFKRSVVLAFLATAPIQPDPKT